MNIQLFGSGNIATYFMQQWSLAKVHTIFLSTNNLVFKEYWINNYSNCFDLDSNSHNKSIDVVVVAVKDDGIETKLNLIPSTSNALVVHTSGAMSMDLLKKFKRRGVLYPLQSFSKQNQLTYNVFPFIIESQLPEDIELLKQLFPNHTHYLECNSEDRKKFHLAAVVVANFSNHLLCLVHRSFKDSNFKIDALKELVFETLHKAFDSGPCINQTGPAIRKDYKTIATHQEMLANNSELLTIYNTLTNSILNKTTNE